MSPDQLCSLIETHFSTLLLYARRWSHDAAEDIVQDAFVQMVKRCRREGAPEHPLAWLFQVVRNAAIDRFRKEQTRREHEESFARTRSVVFETPPDAGIRAGEIGKMLEKLPPDQYEILLARIWGGLKFEEIAKLLGIPKTTVFRSYSAALNSMREQNEPGSY